MAAYIKMYFASGDVQVSEAPTLTNAVAFTLRADLDEVGTPIKMYVIMDSGYVGSTVVITPTGTTAAKWDMATHDAGEDEPDTWSGYGAAHTIGAVNDTDKAYFWIRAKATNDETPVNDTSVTLVVGGVAAAE